MGDTYFMHIKCEKYAYIILIRKPKGKKLFGGLGIDGWIARWILCKESLRVWTGFIWSKTVSHGRFL